MTNKSDIFLPQKSHVFLHTCATCCKLLSYISTMGQSTRCSLKRLFPLSFQFFPPKVFLVVGQARSRPIEAGDKAWSTIQAYACTFSNQKPPSLDSQCLLKGTDFTVEGGGVHRNVSSSGTVHFKRVCYGRFNGILILGAHFGPIHDTIK